MNFRKSFRKSLIIVSVFLGISSLLLMSCGSSGSSSEEEGATGVVSVDTLEGATDVAVNSTFSKTFTSAVDTDSVTVDTFFIVPYSASTSVSRAAYDGSVCAVDSKLDALVSCASNLNCSLDPVSDLATSTQYSICLTDGILYADGMAFAAEMYTFTTAGTAAVAGGTSTISGTLALSSSASVSRGVEKQSTSAENYKALIVNMDTGEQVKTDVAADDTFSLTAIGNSDYAVNFLDSNYKYVGTLATNSVSDSTLSVALTTGEDQSTTNLGTVAANSTTGQITSSETLNAATDHLAYADANGVIAGGTSGEGTTDYTSTVGATACTQGEATCPDFDHDGVPDIFDTDNNNDGYSDEVDGQEDFCVPATVALTVSNYPAGLAAEAAQTGWPTPDEVDANTAGTKYQINLTATPREGYSISDISQISVSTPDYITLYGYVANVTSAHECFNTLWNTCNGQKLMLSSDGSKYEIGISREGSETGASPILDNMFPGDTFILNFTMADETEHVCSRKINIIPKYYPYAVTKAGTAVNTSLTAQLDWSLPFTLGWSIPSRGPLGMTYNVYVYAYANCGQTVGQLTPTIIDAGQDATSQVLNSSNMPTSAVNYFSFNIYATTLNGDEAYATSVNFSTDAANPCP